MKKFISGLTWGALALTITLLPTSSHAFAPHNMTQAQYDELRVLVQTHSDVTSFLEAAKTKLEALKADRKVMKDSIEHSVENIDNGIIKTITSDNADAITKLHAKEDRHPEREGITRTLEKTSNGLRITITSDDSELVEKLQNRSARKGNGKRFNRRGRLSQDDQQLENGEGSENQFQSQRTRMRRGFGGGNRSNRGFRRSQNDQ